MGDLASEFRGAVLRATPLAPYDRRYGATVRSQDVEAQTVDLEVDDPAIKEITDVPIRLGVSNARVVLPEGTRVRLAFESGDGELPFVGDFDAAPDATRGAARVDDEVDVGELRFLTGATIPPPLGPLPSTAFAVQHWLNGAPTGAPVIVSLSGPGIFAVPLKGLIKTGSERLLLNGQ